jgi:hypothetical protein
VTGFAIDARQLLASFSASGNQRQPDSKRINQEKDGDGDACVHIGSHEGCGQDGCRRCEGSENRESFYLVLETAG